MDLHGIIFADRLTPGLGELVSCRTAASLPFAGRYRLIDFPLSSMQNAGIHDVDVIMQRDFQSLLDHIGSGKTWDMSRKRGGLRLLPPFGEQDSGRGSRSTMDVLESIRNYIRDARQDYFVLTTGTLAANIDLVAAVERHLSSGASVTIVCSDSMEDDSAHRFFADEDDFITNSQKNSGQRCLSSLDTCIVSKNTLLHAMDICRDNGGSRSHIFALQSLIDEGCLIAAYIHSGHSVYISSVERYYGASMELLDKGLRDKLFPPDRPVNTKVRSDVSTYYGEGAKVSNSLIADGCYIEGEIENCLLFRGVHVGRGSVLKNCIMMQDAFIGDNTALSYVISDKDTRVSDGSNLAGSPKLQLILPKMSSI